MEADVWYEVILAEMSEIEREARRLSEIEAALESADVDDESAVPA